MKAWMIKQRLGLHHIFELQWIHGENKDSVKKKMSDNTPNLKNKNITSNITEGSWNASEVLYIKHSELDISLSAMQRLHQNEMSARVCAGGVLLIYFFTWGDLIRKHCETVDLGSQPTESGVATVRPEVICYEGDSWSGRCSADHWRHGQAAPLQHHGQIQDSEFSLLVRNTHTHTRMYIHTRFQGSMWIFACHRSLSVSLTGQMGPVLMLIL